MIQVRVDVYHHGLASESIEQKLDMLLFQGGKVMATVQELSDELDQIKAAVDGVKATVQTQIDEIAKLKAQLEAGTGPVTQAQLDELDAKADSILAALTPAP
jgi:archaellum component FlaC